MEIKVVKHKKKNQWAALVAEGLATKLGSWDSNSQLVP